MSRAPLTVVPGPQDAAARSRIAAQRGREDALTACREVVTELGVYVKRLDEVASLEMAPPGVRDLYSRLAEHLSARALVAAGILERVDA